MKNVGNVKADAYGNTIVFTAPGADGVWFTDDDTQSSYGANEIIYCGYPDGSGFRGLDDASPQCRCSATPLNQHDPESELCYVRNRTYKPPLGRWLQRDPIGYAGGIDLYEYVGGRAVTALDPTGLACFVPCASFAAALITFWLACDTATGACPASVVPEPGEPAVLGACITAILAAIAAFIAADAAGVDCVKCLKKDCHPNKARNTQQQIEQMQQEIDKLEAELKKLEGH